MKENSFFLYETAAGYAIFKVNQIDEVALQQPQVQTQLFSFSGLTKMVSLEHFAPFQTPEDALDNINSICEAVVHPFLKSALEMAFKSPKKVLLGVSDEKLGAAIKEMCGIQCDVSSTFNELIRAVRANFHKFLKEVPKEEISKAQLGLAHSYSRTQVKFSTHRADINIINSMSLLDVLDKDINTFAMRVREWYGYHFPELYKLETDIEKYALLVQLIQNKSRVTKDWVPKVEAVVGDPDHAAQIVHAAGISMGYEISELDMAHICSFAGNLAKLARYRKNLFKFLSEKMNAVAPNLTELIGEQVGARLISKAGSIVTLGKLPASTLQILGAEKALFRALKTKSTSTPKYGLIYHSGFIARAGAKNKGRISRFLANKASIATRIDAFSEGKPTNAFGSALKGQVNERLNFYETGQKPEKNIDVMKRVIDEVTKEGLTYEAQQQKRKPNSSADHSVVKREKLEEVAPSSKKEKKQKKSKANDSMDIVAPEKEKTEKTPSKKEKKEKTEKTPSKKEKKEKTEDTPSKKEKKEKTEDTPSKKEKKEKTPKKKDSNEQEKSENTPTKTEKLSKKEKKERRLSAPEFPSTPIVASSEKHQPQSEKKQKKSKKEKKKKNE